MEDRASRYFNEGASSFNLGKHAEAVASCDKALAINPNFANAWRTRGLALRYLGRHVEAVVSYDKALDIKSNYTDAWNNRGVALVSCQHNF